MTASSDQGTTDLLFLWLKLELDDPARFYILSPKLLVLHEDESGAGEPH
jgi:hypothetical protein